MDLTRTAYGTWSGGRFMHFGEPLSDERFVAAIRHAYERGIRTFMTSDVYGKRRRGRNARPRPRRRAARQLRARRA